MLDDVQLQRIIEELDNGVPKEGAVVQFEVPDELRDSRLIANKLGYLRLGTDLLRAALAPGRDPGSPESIDVDLAYLHSAGTTIEFGSFRRREPTPPEPLQVSPWKDKLQLIGCALVAFVLMFLLFLGVRALPSLFH